MRRASLVGPLVIVLIGVVFLMNTLRPELPLFDLAATYWPYLLIGWGALRLLEVLFWTARSQPLPASGIGGGEWTLIVFICVIGSGLFFVNEHRPWRHLGIFADKRLEVFGHPYDYSLAEQRKPSGKAPRVLVENLRGNTQIVVGDPQEVKVSGRKTVRALQESDAAEANRQSAVEISGQDEQLVVRTNQDRVTGERRVSTDLEISVPRGASVEIHGREGDVSVTGAGGNVEVTGDSGSVRLQSVSGNVRIDLRRSDLVRAAEVKGNLEITVGKGRDLELESVGGQTTVNGSYYGDLRFEKLAQPLRMQDARGDLRVEKVPGKIQMDLRELTATKLVGPIKFSSRSRDVRIEEFSRSVEIQLDRGDITLRPVELPLAQIDAQTRSGQVELSLPEKANFELKGTARRGEVQNQFGPPLQVDYEGGKISRGVIYGAVGKGATVSLTSERGAITVRKDSGVSRPLPPDKPEKRVVLKTGEGALVVEKN